MSNEFKAIRKRVESAAPSQLRNDAMDLINAQRAQTLLTIEMAAVAQMAQQECAALRQKLDAVQIRAEEAEAKLAAAYRQNSLLAGWYNELDDALAAANARAERAEGEAAGLRAGYADLQAAAERAEAENALLRMTIAGIQTHGGGWAEARIEEAIGDE